MSADTVIARYLAPGGAHVTITQVERKSDRDSPTDVSFETACEACGPFDKVQNVSDYRYFGYNAWREDPHAARRAREAVDKNASAHAETCRRIPERLWPEDGAR
jgi:hypothetical protein